MKITYIDHSGFLVELEKTVLLFDYFRGTIPEIAEDKKLIVFASHGHRDHYQPAIWELAKKYQHVSYVISDDIKIDKTYRDNDICVVSPANTYQIGDLKLETFQSTDEGVAFYMECQGHVIYHAGDLNWWHWEEESEQYNQAMANAYCGRIDQMAGRSIEVAFLPLDGRLGNTCYLLGMDYFLRSCQVKTVFPMHFWGEYSIIEKAKADNRSEPYRDKIQVITKKNHVFQIEGD